jgi:hypothetical protein
MKHILWLVMGTEQECWRNWTKNIKTTIELIMAYLCLCEPWQKKSRICKEGVVKPRLHNEMNSHCQIVLTDMQSNPDRINKFILVYQDHLAKFILLWSLETRRAEVAYHLSDIFTTFRAYNNLHSDNRHGFIIRKLNSYVLCGMT